MLLRIEQRLFSGDQEDSEFGEVQTLRLAELSLHTPYAAELECSRHRSILDTLIYQIGFS
jgi:hypothetical protein